jgi:hypothetical protein
MIKCNSKSMRKSRATKRDLMRIKFNKKSRLRTKMKKKKLEGPRTKLYTMNSEI